MRHLRAGGKIAAGFGSQRSDRPEDVEGGVVLFDPDGKRLGPAWAVREGAVSSLAFRPDGSLAAGYLGTPKSESSPPTCGVVLFDATGNRLRPTPLDVPGRIVGIAPTGNAFAVFHSRGLWLFDGSPVRFQLGSIEVNEGFVTDLAYRSDGSLVASYYTSAPAMQPRRGGVLLFNADGHREGASAIEVKEGPVICLAVGPGDAIAAGYIRADGGGSRVLRLDARFKVRGGSPIEVKEGWVNAMAFGPGGVLAAGYGFNKKAGEAKVEGGVLLLDSNGKRLRAPLDVKEGEVEGLAFGPRGVLAVGYVAKVPVDFGNGVKTSRADRCGVMLFDPQGRQIRSIALEPYEGTLESVAFGTDGSLAIGCDESGILIGGNAPSLKDHVFFFDAGGNRIRPPLEMDNGILNSVTFGPTGVLAVGSNSGLNSVLELFDARGVRLWPSAMKFGGRLDSASLMRVAFGPRGRLAAVGIDPNPEDAPGDLPKRGGITFFDVDPASWRRKAAQTVNRNLRGYEWAQYFHEVPYRRTIRSLPFPLDLSVDGRGKAEAFEKAHPEEDEAR